MNTAHCDFTPEELEAALATGDPELIELAQQYLALTTPDQALRSWTPRPDNPDQHDQQESFLNDTASRFVVALGGNMSGKSVAAAVKFLRFLLYQQAPPVKDTFAWVVSVTADTTADTCWPKLRQFLPPDAIAKKADGSDDISWENEQAQRPAVVRLKPWGPHGGNYLIQFKAAAQGRTKFQGAAVMAVWITEAIEDWLIVVEIMKRLREWPESRLIYEQTPLVPQPALEKLSKAKPEDRAGWAFYHMNAYCNFYADPVIREAAISASPEEMRDTVAWGAWGSYSGAIFKELRDSHFVEPFEIPNDWPKYRGIDFGQHCACVWAAFDPGNERWVIFRDFYHNYNKAKAGLRAGELIGPIRAVPWEGEFCLTTFSDHDPTWIAELRFGGINCVRARKEPVNGSIECIRKLLLPQKDGRPGLLIFNTCVDLESQMRAYRWDKEKNVPVKENDHTVDCLRYILFSKASGIRVADAPPLNLGMSDRGRVAHGELPSALSRRPASQTLAHFRANRRSRWG